MSNAEDQLNYIKNHLIPKIVNDLDNKALVDTSIHPSSGLDGFMSALYRVRINLKDTKTDEENVHHVIVKFMKGNESFRETSKSYTQFANEIFIYSKALPYYEDIIKKSKSSIKVTEWIPYVYFAKYGKIEGLGNDSSPEAVLALEDLKPKGYRCGPRLCLDRQHLLLMMKPLAEYHSLTYAMRLKNDEQLEKFVQQIIPLPWFSKEGETNSYFVVYRAAFDRFFLYFDKMKHSYDDKEFVSNVEKIRKYQSDPTELLERFREVDNVFSVILHGDYNRNNVLFKYDTEDTFDNPRDVKMIDFQELRYGTPAIDLSFFMYMNTDPKIRDDVWMELLQHYYKTMLNSLTEILQISNEHELLEPYRFEKFYEHFSKFAFYGVLVCMHFLPWMYCSEKECSQLSHLFATDMHSEEFNKLAIEAGGEYVDEIIMNIVKHANRMGYMNAL